MRVDTTEKGCTVKATSTIHYYDVSFLLSHFLRGVVVNTFAWKAKVTVSVLARGTNPLSGLHQAGHQVALFLSCF